MQLPLAKNVLRKPKIGTQCRHYTQIMTKLSQKAEKIGFKVRSSLSGAEGESLVGAQRRFYLICRY